MRGPEILANVPPSTLTDLKEMLEDGTTTRAAEQWLKAQGLPGSKSAVARWKAKGYPFPSKPLKQLELDLTTDYFDPAFDLKPHHMKWFYGQAEHFAKHPELLARWLQDIGYNISTTQFIEWMHKRPA